MAAVHAALLLWMVSLTTAGPLPLEEPRLTQCATFCPANSKFGYEEGKTYEYTYSSTIKTHIPSSPTSGGSLLHLSTTCHIQVISNCDMLLHLSDVTLQDAHPHDVTQREGIPRGASLRASLERFPLRFAWVGGHVEGVCPAQEEEGWVLNVKRGILSGLQNVMNDFTIDIRTRETDVVGECPVEYQTMGTGWDGTHTIMKTKHLEDCFNRQDTHTVLQGVPYNTQSSSQRLSVLKGTHKCIQTINSRGLLTGSTCTESHSFQPLSASTGAATTDVQTVLTLKGARTSVDRDQGHFVGELLPLLYDHMTVSAESGTARQEAQTLLQGICHQGSATAARATAPSVFGRLVHALRQVDGNELFGLHLSAKQGDLCKKAGDYLRDAIPMVGTAASARLIRELVMAAEVTQTELTTWMASLALVQSPTAPMLAEVTPLLQDPKLAPKVVLSISSMVNNFCRQRGATCGAVREVRAIVNILHTMLGVDCTGPASSRASSSSSPGGDPSSMVLLALKALGNTGHVQTVVDTLNQCLQNGNIGMDVRVAAVQAFRHTDCDTDMSGLLRLYEDPLVDSELRINAYIALMSSCPSPSLLQKVKTRLQVEETNQVGSYVWTHLTNIQETSSPLKQHLRRLLEDQHLTTKFDLDKMKYSRNIEKGFYSERLAAGAAVESDLIWSQDSFIPRSASVNLTVQLFGQEVNLLEVGGRVDGVQDVLQGLFDKHTPPDGATEKLPDIEELDKKIPHKPATTPHGSYYLRVFGNEIAYSDIHNLDAATLRDKFNQLNWLSQLAKDGQVDFSKNFQFLDSSLSVPTISGFPVRLRVEGNAVTELKMKGKMDIGGVLRGSKNLILEAHIAPSATLELVAEMSVGAGGEAEGGVRTLTTLHTSTMADGKVELKDGQVFSIDINMPKDTMDVISAKHELMILRRGQPQATGGDPQGGRLEVSQCLGGRFTTITGLEVCGDLSLPPAPGRSGWEALTQPAHMSLRVNKKDSFTKYHFQASLHRISEGHSTDHARLTLNTPGSTTDREITLDYLMNPLDQGSTLQQLELKSPWKKAKLKASTVSRMDLKRLLLHGTVDDSRQYHLEADLQMGTNSPGSLLYKPSLKLTLPGLPAATMTGLLQYTQYKKYRVELALENILRLPVSMHGDVSVTSEGEGKRRLEASAAVKSEWVNGGLEGFMERLESDEVRVHSSRVRLYYAGQDEAVQSVVLSNKIRDTSTKGKLDYTITSGLTTTMAPEYNYDMLAAMSLSDHDMAVRVDGTLNNDATRSLYIKQNATFSFYKKRKAASFDLHVKLPLKEVDHRVRLEYKQFPDEFLTSALVHSGQDTLGEVNLHLERSLEGRKVVGKLHYPGRHVELSEELTRDPDGRYHHVMSLQHQQDQKLVCVTNIKTGPHLEFNTKVTSPFYDTVQVGGFLEHRPWLVNVMLEASMGVDHSVSTSLGFENSVVKFHLSPNIDIKTPKFSRGFFSSVTILKWDQYQIDIGSQRGNREPESFSTDFKISKTNPHFKIKVEDRYYKKETYMSYNLQHNHGTTHDCQFDGLLYTKSKHGNRKEDYFEAFIKSSHIDNQIDITTRLTVDDRVKTEHSGNLNIKRNAEWTQFEGKAEAVATSDGEENFNLTLGLEYSENFLKANGKAHYEDNEFDIAIQGRNLASGIEGSMEISSPYYQLEKALITLKYTSQGVQSATDILFSMTSRGEITKVTMARKQEFSPVYKNSGDIALTFSKHPKDNHYFTWSRREDGTDITTNATLNTDTSEHKVIYVSKTTGQTRKADLEFINNFKYGPAILRSTYIESPNNVNLVATIEEKNRISQLLDIVVNHNGLEFDADIEFYFLTHFKCVTSNKKENGVWVSSYRFDQMHGASDRIWQTSQINTRFRTDGSEFEGHVKREAGSSYTPNLNIDIKKEMNKWSGNIDFKGKKASYSYYPDVSVSGGVDFSKDRQLVCSLDFSMPSTIGNVSAAVDISGTLWDFTTKLDFTLHNVFHKTSLDVRVNLADMNNIDIKVDWDTPYTWLRNGQLAYNHKIMDDYSVITSGNFQIPGYKLTFNNNLNFKSWRSFQTKTNINYGQHGKLVLNTRFESAETTSGLLEVETPYSGMEYRSLKFNYKGPIRDCKGNIEIGLDRERSISISIQRYHYRDIHFITRIITPFTNYRTMGIDFNFVGYMDDYKQDWAFTLEDKRLAGQNDFYWKGTTIDYTSAMQTPLSGFENLIFKFKHEGPLNSFEHHATFEYSAGKSRINNAFSYGDNRVSAKSNIKLAPLLLWLIQIPDDISLIIDHNGHWSNFANNIKVKVSKVTYGIGNRFIMDGPNVDISSHIIHPDTDLSVAVKHTGQTKNTNGQSTLNIFGHTMNVSHELDYTDGVKGKLDIKTTFEDINTLGLEFEFKGSLSDFENSASLQVNAHEYSVGSQFLMDAQDNQKLSAKVFMSTPKQYRVSISKSGPIRNLRTSTIIQIGESLTTVETKLVFTGVETDASISITTPFNSYKKIQMDFKHRQGEGAFEVEGSVNVDTQRYNGGFKIQHGQNVSVGVEFKTPSNSVIVDSMFEGTMTDNKGRVSATFNRMNFVSRFEFKLERDSLYMKARLAIPEEYSITIRANREANAYNSVIVIGMRERNIHWTTNIRNRRGDVGFAMDMLTPYQHFERQSVRFSYTGHLNEFKTSGHVESSVPGYSSIGFNVNHNGRVSQFGTSADLHTPFNLLKTASISVNHHAGRNYLKTDVTVNYNRAFLSTAIDLEKIGNDIKVSTILDSSFQGYEKFIFKLNKKGHLNDFQTSLVLNTPLRLLSTLDVNLRHSGHGKHFSNGVIINYNGNMVKASTDINIVKNAAVSLSLELPLKGYEKFTLSYSQRAEGKVYFTILHAETPFDKFKSIDFKFKVLPTIDKFELSMTAHLIKPMELNFKNRIMRNGMTTSASLLLPELRINLVNSMSRTLTRMTAAGSIETSIDHLNRFAYTCGLDGGEEDMLHLTAKVDHPFPQYASPGLQLSVKLMEDWRKDLEITAIITTLSKSEAPINMNIMHKYGPDLIATSAYVVYRNRKLNGAFQYSRQAWAEEWTGLLDIPITGYERFAYNFRQTRKGMARAYSGRLDTPFNNIINPSFDVEFEKTDNTLKTSGTITTPFKWMTPITGSFAYEKKVDEIICNGNIQANLKYVRVNSHFMKGDNSLMSTVNVDTSFRGYKKSGFKFEGSNGPLILNGKLNIILPKALKTPNPVVELKHNGAVGDFNTKLNLQLPSRYIKPISIKLKHKFTWLDLDTKLASSYGTLSYTANVKLLKIPSEFTYHTSLTLPTKDSFSIDMKHFGNIRSFSSSLKIQTPYKQYADPEVEIMHETFPNSCSSSIRLVTHLKDVEPATITIENRGHRKDFVTNIRARYNGQTISLNGAFEEKGRNIKASGEVNTPFYNYEHFGFAFSHNENGRTIRTAGNVVLPFREYVSPSFDIDHRGHMGDFKTKVTIITPFQNIDPVELNVDHRGSLKNFQTTANAIYQGQITRTKAIFRLSQRDVQMSTLVNVPLLNGDKLSLSIDYQNDGNIILAKSTIKMPYLSQEKLSFEVGSQGVITDFRVHSKIEGPFPWGTLTSFRLDHRGSLHDFNAKASIDVDGRRSEWEVQYRGQSSSGHINHEVFTKVTTPWRWLRKGDVSISHAVRPTGLSGSIKGAYNRKTLDADYTLSFGNDNTLDVTIQKPIPMRYTFTLNREAKTALGYLNWDKRSSMKHVRIEASLWNLVNDESTTKRAQIKVSHPRRNMLFKAGHIVTPGKADTELHIKWGDHKTEMIRVELERSTNSQQNAVRKLKIRALGVRGELEEEVHEGTTGSRHIGKVSVHAQTALIITSDVTTTEGGVRATFHLDHPRLTQKHTMTIETHTQSSPIRYTGKVDIGNEKGKLSVTWKLADESTSSRVRYVTEAQVRLPEASLHTHLGVILEEVEAVLTTSVRLSHLEAATRIRRTLSISSTLDRPKEQFSLQLKTPEKTIDIGALRTVGASPTSEQYVLTMAHDDSLTAVDVQYNTATASFDVTAGHSHLAQGRQSTAEYNHADIMATRVTAGKVLHVLGRYNPGKHLNFKAYHQMATTEQEDIQVDISLQGDQVIKARVFVRPGVVQDTIGTLQTLFHISNTISDIRGLVARTADVIYKRTVEIGRVGFAPLIAMVNHNDFYLGHLYDALTVRLEYIKLEVRSMVSRLEDLCTGYLGTLRTLSAATYRRVTRKVKVISAHITGRLQRLRRRLDGSLLEAVDYIARIRSLQQLNSVMDSVVQHLATRGQHLVLRVRSAMTSTMNIVPEPYRQHLQSWSLYIYSQAEPLLSQLTSLDAQLDQLRLEGLGPVRTVCWEVLRGYLHLDYTRVVVWRPDRGLLEVELYVPVLLRDVGSFPSYLEYIKDAQDYVQDVVAMTKRVFYSQRPSVRMENWIPPFKAHAIVAGGRHFMTFDKRFYDFTGQCSYLLVHDVVDHKFAVTINYHQVNGSYRKKSLTVVHNSNQVELLNNFRVIINGRSSQLPVSLNHMSLYREGETLNVDIAHGVLVTCQPSDDICTVLVSGWHHNKLTGLLGNFNNEPADDFLLSNGSRVGTSREMADSWTVGTPCSIGNQVSSTMTSSRQNTKTCREIFKMDSSNLAPCFIEVDQEPFMRMCRHGDVCQISAFYVTECGLRHVPVSVPKQCAHREGLQRTDADLNTNKAADMNGLSQNVVSARTR